MVSFPILDVLAIGVRRCPWNVTIDARHTHNEVGLIMMLYLYMGIRTFGTFVTFAEIVFLYSRGLVPESELLLLDFEAMIR